MVPTLKIDASNINRIFHTIAKYSGAPLQRVVEYESQKVIETCLRRTRAASLANIVRDYQARTFGQYDVGNGMKKYCLTNRYPDALWARILAIRKRSLKGKVGARGLAKRSWQDMAAKADILVAAPKYVATALASNGRVYDDTSARAISTRNTFGLYFENRYPVIGAIGGHDILRRSLAGRARYFRKNLQMGVFFDLKKIERAYPGMILK